MASMLMKSVSGIRGVVGETMTPELIVQVGAAFAKFAKKGTIVIGRDSRPTGEVIVNNVKAVLNLAGCNVIDVGIVPTPTVQLMVEELKAAAGIVISASHNPIEWNAFKLINSAGTFLNEKEIAKVFKDIDGEAKFVKWNAVGSTTFNTSAEKIHIKKVLDVVSKSKIKKSKFKVALDSVNGAGSIITQELLTTLGCSIKTVNCIMNGEFPRGAEPTPDNLTDLSELVKKNKSDIGFAQDPDADRLAIVDENGNPIGEEYTMALVTEHLLSKEKGRVVVNLSTTKAVEDVAAKYNVKFTRAKVGEINVVDEMRKKAGARIGGEGNGGVISPEVHLGRDSLVGIGYILEMMAERKMKISELVNALPTYFMKKGKVKYDAKTFDKTILDKLAEEFSDEKLSTIDGLRIDFKKHEKFNGGWVHLRSSNTEPIFRIISEGVDEKQMNAIYNTFAKRFK